MAINKRNRAATASLTLLAVSAGILVLVNVLGSFWYGRLDVTENRAYSLSQGSERLASNLDDKMLITAYFTEDLPPPFNATERYVRDLLVEYEAVSGGDIEFRMVHPDTEEERQEAEEAGVQRVRHQVVEDDSLSMVEGYRGIVIKYLGDKKVIPTVQDTAGLEYTITTSMKELVGEKRTIGVLKGHGSPTPQQGLTRLRDHLPNYELKQISAEEPIDDSVAALLIVAPVTALEQKELLHIDQYVMRGGSVGFFGGSMKVNAQNFQSLGARTVDTKVNRLLSRWGVKLRSDIVADAQCQNLPLQGRMGLSVMVPYPPIPVVMFEEDEREHPVLFRLNAGIFPFTSSIVETDSTDEQVDVMHLAKTSNNSWQLEGETIPLQVKPPQQWSPSGNLGPFTVLAAIEGQPRSAFAQHEAMSSAEPEQGPEPEIERAQKKARILVYGTGSLLNDQFLPTPEQMRQRRMNSGVAIVLNSIDWLAQDSDLIAIRAKTVEDPTLEVPAAVQEAKEEAVQAEQQAKAAAQTGDRESAEQAMTEQERALERRKEALDAWDAKKQAYRWANIIGIPALLALFGVIRWRMRVAKKQTLKA